jgi:hypothetical protein
LNKDKQFYTYLHCRPNGDIFYVGKGSGYRAFNLKRRNKHHTNIINKYGRENILVYLFYCTSERQAFDDEISQISQLRREGYLLVNVTDGGEGVSGFVLSKEARLKISLKNKGRKYSEEQNKEKSLRMMGVKHSQERCTTKSLSMKGKPKPEHIRKKISEALKGKYFQVKVSCIVCHKEGYVTGMVSSHLGKCKYKNNDKQ